MTLTGNQVREFRETGYTAAEVFFSAREVRAMRAEVDRFSREGLLHNVATDGDGRTRSKESKNLQLCPMYRHSHLFRALPFEPKVVEAVTRLIGDPIVLHMDQVFLKPGRCGAGTNWHQDNAYFKIEDPIKGMAMWIAVHDATVANGTIRVVPGVFGEALPHDRDPDSDHHIRCFPDESKAVTVELPAGGVAFFCYGTPHCTGANDTDSERAGLAYHFLHAEYAHNAAMIGNLTEKDCDYHPYLSGPDATGGENEYGQRVAGTWEAEIDSVLAAASQA